VLDNLPIGVALNRIDDGVALYFNKKFEDIYGWSKHDIEDVTNFFNKVYPDERYRKELLARIMADIQSGDPSRMHWEDCLITHPDNSKHVVNAVNIPLFDQNTMVSTVIDITEIRKAESEIKKNEEKYRTLSELSPEMIFLADRNGDITYLNKTAAEQFRVDPAEIVGKNMTDLFPTDIASIGLEKFKMVFETKSPSVIELEMKFPFGNAWVSARLSPVFDSENQVISVLGLAIDITERKMAELELLKLSSAVDQSPATVVITNRKGDIEYVNQKFCDITGYSKEEVIGNNPRILNSGYHDKKFFEEFWNTLLSGNNWSGELLNKKKNGELYWESSLLYPLINNQGEITNFIAIKEDITEKKKLMSELIESKEKAELANNLKDAFIANMSHEIRTPLNGILGMSRLIKDLFSANVKKEDEILFDGIELSSKRIIRTIDMILNYSRIQVGAFPIFPKKINLSSICMNLVREYSLTAQMKSLELSFKNNYGDTTIFADEYSITMAISNLIENAIKYTDKGLITLILYKGKNDNIILDVKDTGIGISDKYLEKIFEPYQQEHMGYGRAYEGVGLGLSLTKQVLVLNNAEILVESKKGKGTTFSINFGKDGKAPENKIEAEQLANIIPAPDEQRKKVVLIVEDDLLNQFTIKKFIEKSYITIFTDSSDEVMAIINKDKVDIILMDISIKGSRNGLDLTRELKAAKEFSHIPVIAITAHAFESDKQNALEAGCSGFLAKPFTKESLLIMIKDFVNKSI
jgi:hypothetical protein